MIPDTPPMTAPLPWRVWQINDVDWVMARSEREALGFYLEWSRDCGDHRTEDEHRADGDIGPLFHELTDIELAEEVFCDLADGSQKSFADELAERAKTVTVPMYFAGTEY
jgi:hypothetical protein